MPDGDRIEVDAFEAADVDTPSREVRDVLSGFFRCAVARASKRQDATGRTEIVLGRARVLLVLGKFVERCKKSKLVLLDAVNQRSAPATNRAIARSNVIQLEIDLEPNPTTVAGAAVGRHAA
jgi:hypothetical protein